MNLRERAKQLKKDIPAVFLCLNSHETPIAAKLLAGITVAYALSPIDLIPDFIPVLGYLDDLLILPALIALTIRLIPKEKFDRCRKEAEGMWNTGSPKKWYYAIPIAAIWLLIAWLAIRAIFL
ncbi:MAG: YkvA family protein [Lawsonibacter sp.]